jgi:dihydrofolate reductase
MKEIVAVDKNWGIGKDGDLLIHLPGDMKFFREKTMGKVVVMGRSTLESLPNGKPLPGRKNIVLSRNPDFEAECPACRSEEQLLRELAEMPEEEVFVIGGAQIYRTLLPYCDTVYVTRIDSAFPADTHFTDLDQCDDWELVRESEPCAEKGVTYRFTEYKRK